MQRASTLRSTGAEGGTVLRSEEAHLRNPAIDIGVPAGKNDQSFMWTSVQSGNRSSFWGGVLVLAVWGASAAELPVSPLAVARDADGRLELFKTDADGTLRYRWQRQPGSDWSPWSGLGGLWLSGLGAAATDARQ